MADPVRPGEQAARNMYARGYRTWFNIFQIASREPNLPVNCLSRLQTAFPNLPRLPENIDINNSFTNIALAKGTTTWVPTPESGNLPSFQEEILFNLAWDQSTRIMFSEDPKYTSAVLAENLGSAADTSLFCSKLGPTFSLRDGLR